MHPRLIAMDLDGTLYTSDKQIDSRTIAVLARMQAAGAQLALISARPLPGLYHARDALNLNQTGGLLVACNGARIADARSGALLHAEGMTLQQAQDMLRALEALPVTPILDDGKQFYVTSRTGYMVAYECRNNRMRCSEVENLADFIHFAPAKLLLAMAPDALSSIQARIARMLPEALAVVQTAPFYLEIVPRSVNKGKALLDACRLLEIDPAQSVAFGDAENDIPMLRAAGLGVAMGNADPRVRDAAALIAPTNDDAGIACVLESLLSGEAL